MIFVDGRHNLFLVVEAEDNCAECAERNGYKAYDCHTENGRGDVVAVGVLGCADDGE